MTISDNPAEMHPRTGRLLKEDRTTVNEADLISGAGVFVRPLASGGIQFVADAHSRVHRGELFCASILVSNLANSASFDVAVTSGASVATHIVPMPTLGGSFDFYVYETPTFTLGTALASHNQKFGSANTLDATFVHTPTLTNDGTLRRVFELPGGSGGQAVGGAADFGAEVYIPAAGKALFRMTNVSGQARSGSVMLFAYNTAPIADA